MLESEFQDGNCALDATPGKHAKSAEAVESKGDVLRSGTKECKREKQERACGRVWRGRGLVVTTHVNMSLGYGPILLLIMDVRSCGKSS